MVLKRIAIALGIIVAIPVCYVAVVCCFGSEDARTRLVLTYATIVARHNPPAIAATGVISDGPNWMMTEPASSKFTAILRKRFPPGSSIQAMRTALTDQSFKPAAGLANRLECSWGGAPCNSGLTVSWAADRSGRLETIQGYYGATCL